jgi:hypothetical protein
MCNESHLYIIITKRNANYVTTTTTTAAAAAANNNNKYGTFNLLC